MKVVADAGPIISFARAHHEDLLRKILREIIIPEAVYADIGLKGSGKPGASLVQESGWINRSVVSDQAKMDPMPKNLGAGEREAIVLAEELNLPLLIDDRTARRQAEDRGIVCFGSLRVLKEGKEQGVLIEVKPVLDALRRAGLHIGNTLYQAFLQEMGE